MFKINIDFWFSKAIKSKIYPKVDLLFLDLFKRIGHDIIGKGISFLQSLIVFLKQKKKNNYQTLKNQDGGYVKAFMVKIHHKWGLYFSFQEEK